MLNLLSLEISPELIAELKEATDNLSKVIGKFPNDLPTAGRNRQNMGQASRGYVQEAHTSANAHPEVIPARISTGEMQKDLNNVTYLDPVLSVLMPEVAKLQNIRSLAGQDLMNAANEIKKNFNSAAKNDAKYKAISESLNKRYEKAKREKVDPPAVGGDVK